MPSTIFSTTVRRLAGVGELRAVDLLLLLEHVGRHVLAADVPRIGGRDVQRQLLHERLEVVGARDEVGLAVHLDEHADLAAHVDVAADDALARGAARALGGRGEPLLAQQRRRPSPGRRRPR